MSRHTDNLVPRVLSYPPYGYVGRVGENPGNEVDILDAQDFFDRRELTDCKSSERPYYYKHLYSFPFFKML